jgi:hypothetical protein
MTLLSDTAYPSFIGEVEALNTTTIRRLIPSARHQLPAIARTTAYLGKAVSPYSTLPKINSIISGSALSSFRAYRCRLVAVMVEQRNLPAREVAVRANGVKISED